MVTAYLFHSGSNSNPIGLVANEGKSFIGSYVLGMGFTFDDNDTSGVASPLGEMHRLIAGNPRSAERIFPYIGGEEINDSPTQSHRRYVINFGEMSEEEARQWPELMQILETRVKGTRASHSTAPWWQFERPRGDLYRALASVDRAMCLSRVGQALAFAYLPTRMVFSEAVVVFLLDGSSEFALMQSRVHELWARFFASSMKDDLRYTPSDCFETFPFPAGCKTNVPLEQIGSDYYGFRAALMVRNNEGLTKTYNRFHDPAETSADILKLRELHAAMDRAVLDAYGWTDLVPTCEFLLDYEEEDEDENSGTSKKKKPWRYRWPDEFRDEVLARLLELNKHRAEEETIAGVAAEATAKAAGKKPARKKAGSTHPERDGPGLFH